MRHPNQKLCLHRENRVEIVENLRQAGHDRHAEESEHGDDEHQQDRRLSETHVDRPADLRGTSLDGDELLQDMS